MQNQQNLSDEQYNKVLFLSVLKQYVSQWRDIIGSFRNADPTGLADRIAAASDILDQISDAAQNVSVSVRNKKIESVQADENTLNTINSKLQAIESGSGNIEQFARDVKTIVRNSLPEQVENRDGRNLGSADEVMQRVNERLQEQLPLGNKLGQALQENGSVDFSSPISEFQTVASDSAPSAESPSTILPTDFSTPSNWNGESFIESVYQQNNSTVDTATTSATNSDQNGSFLSSIMQGQPGPMGLTADGNSSNTGTGGAPNTSLQGLSMDPLSGNQWNYGQNPPTVPVLQPHPTINPDGSISIFKDPIGSFGQKPAAMEQAKAEVARLQQQVDGIVAGGGEPDGGLQLELGLAKNTVTILENNPNISYEEAKKIASNQWDEFVNRNSQTPDTADAESEAMRVFNEYMDKNKARARIDHPDWTEEQIEAQVKADWDNFVKQNQISDSYGPTAANSAIGDGLAIDTRLLPVKENIARLEQQLQAAASNGGDTTAIQFEIAMAKNTLTIMENNISISYEDAKAQADRDWNNFIGGGALNRINDEIRNLEQQLQAAATTGSDINSIQFDIAMAQNAKTFIQDSLNKGTPVSYDDAMAQARRDWDNFVKSSSADQNTAQTNAQPPLEVAINDAIAESNTPPPLPAPNVADAFSKLEAVRAEVASYAAVNQMTPYELDQRLKIYEAAYNEVVGDPSKNFDQVVQGIYDYVGSLGNNTQAPEPPPAPIAQDPTPWYQPPPPAPEPPAPQTISDPTSSPFNDIAATANTGNETTYWAIEQQAGFLAANAKAIWDQNQWMTPSQAAAQAAVDFSGMILSQNPGDALAQLNHNLDKNAQALISSNPALDWASARNQAQASFDQWAQSQGGGGTPNPAAAESVPVAPAPPQEEPLPWG